MCRPSGTRRYFYLSTGDFRPRLQILPSASPTALQLGNSLKLATAQSRRDATTCSRGRKPPVGE